MAITFIVWDTTLHSLVDTLVYLREHDPDVIVRPLPGDLDHGHLWDDNVRPDLDRADRVLAIVDEPNGNMAFELGYALGQGKPYTLLAAGDTRPEWLKTALLKDLVVNTGGEGLETIQRVLAQRTWATAPARPEPGTEPRLLLPPARTAETPRRHLLDAYHRRLLLDLPGTITRLPESLRGVGRLAWILPPKGRDQRRHGEEVAASAVMAGYAYASGIPLTVLRSGHADPLVDVVHEEQVWNQNPIPQVRAWLGPDAARFPVSAAVDPADIISRWRAWQLDTLDHAIPLLEGYGERLLHDIYVDIEVAAGGCGPGERQLRLREFLAANPRGAVLGEPGAGKTTMTRQLACELAKDPSGPVPVYLPLARHADKPMDPYAIAEGHSGLTGLAAALRARPAGSVWVLLDGLDEVPQPRMESLREQILGFIGANAGVTVLVTGRPVVDDMRAIPPGFTRAVVEPLDVTRQGELVGKLLDPERAAPLVAALRSTPSLAELGRNPLMLSLLALVAREAGTTADGFPRRRTDLYARAIDLLLRRGHGTDPTGVRDAPLARDLLRRLSLDLQGESGESWADADLSNRLWALREQDPVLGYRVKETWEFQATLLDDIGRNSGVLGPHDGPKADWRYLHRSLREFLAAEQLKEEGPARIQGWVADWTRALKVFDEARRRNEKAPDPARWGEVHALLCGLSGDPLPLLHQLREVNPPLARRALRSVDLEPERALAFLEADPQWNEDDIEALLARHGSALRGPIAGWVTPDAALRRLAVAYYVLGEPGEVFFGRIGRALGKPGSTVAVEAGTFTMGSPEGVGDGDEHPAHRVTLTQPFRLGVTPVTDAEWRVFNGKGGRTNVPATGMTWYEARLYCVWVGGDLPTEAEWEYACRAGSPALWCFGNDEGRLAEYAWYNANAKAPMPVGGRKPNAWGLHDMHGNVWEWCADDLRTYVDAPTTDPRGAFGGRRVFRGGAFRLGAVRCRSAYRDRWLPRNGDGLQGFRVRLPAP